jgi:putative transposase
MTNYRRAKFEGGYYFFTLVTHRRSSFLMLPPVRECLRAAWRETKLSRPFEVVALCLLPDHLHCVWKLPEGDGDFSGRWASIKTGFTRRYLSLGGREAPQGISRRRKRERGVWQRRFWEHQIRDESDLQRHVDYIHYNPVKHGLVEDVELCPWSTYHRYLKNGAYLTRHWDDIQQEIGAVFAGEPGSYPSL